MNFIWNSEIQNEGSHRTCYHTKTISSIILCDAAYTNVHVYVLRHANEHSRSYTVLSMCAWAKHRMPCMSNVISLCEWVLYTKNGEIVCSVTNRMRACGTLSGIFSLKHTLTWFAFGNHHFRSMRNVILFTHNRSDNANKTLFRKTNFTNILITNSSITKTKQCAILNIILGKQNDTVQLDIWCFSDF